MDARVERKLHLILDEKEILNFLDDFEFNSKDDPTDDFSKSTNEIINTLRQCRGDFDRVGG